MTRRPNIAALTFLAIFIASRTTTQSMNEGPALADSKVTPKQTIERPRSKSAAESEKQENKKTDADVAGFLFAALLTDVLLAGSAMKNAGADTVDRCGATGRHIYTAPAAATQMTEPRQNR